MNRGRRMSRKALEKRLHHAMVWMVNERNGKYPALVLTDDFCTVIGYELRGDRITISVGDPSSRLQDHLERLSRAVCRRLSIRTGFDGGRRHDPTRVTTMVRDYLEYGLLKRPLSP